MPWEEKPPRVAVKSTACLPACLPAGVPIPAQHFPGCVALDKALNLSGPSLAHLPNGATGPPPQPRRNKETFVQPLEQQLLEGEGAAMILRPELHGTQKRKGDGDIMGDRQLNQGMRVTED